MRYVDALGAHGVDVPRWLVMMTTLGMQKRPLTERCHDYISKVDNVEKSIILKEVRSRLHSSIYHLNFANI